jgi:SAM-dependent methyltransferase
MTQPTAAPPAVAPAYVGGELELFAKARRWKAYFAGVLRPFVGGRVLEVGAGIGANTPFLWNDRVAAWTSLEPDGALARRIQLPIAAPGECRVITGTIAQLDAAERFDAILYIDVLEHIADDAAELARARGHLAPGGHLIVLAPAHQFLFSPFDRAIGHYRRYDRANLLAVAPPQSALALCAMLDSAGFFASLANRAVLSQAAPTARQIALWDRLLVPLSRRLDPLLWHRFGKTTVAVWRAADGSDIGDAPLSS